MGLIDFVSDGKKYSSTVTWSEEEIMKNFSSEDKLNPTVKVSSFVSSYINSSLLIGVPIICL